MVGIGGGGGQGPPNQKKRLTSNTFFFGASWWVSNLLEQSITARFVPSCLCIGLMMNFRVGAPNRMFAMEHMQ